ncbi:MAG: DUF2914 domain-containing protein [Thermoanaerobaculia bacterium]
MTRIENTRPGWAAARRWAPVLFFFAGFAWDALTLGRTIKSIDLFILLGYLAAAAVILLTIGRGVAFRGSEYLNAVLQFLFGGIFSALFIFYFLSSSDLAGFLVVLGLGALLVGNEFLESAYGELTLSWAFFTLCSTMFFNFALAHLFRSISTFWFYIGTLLAVLLVTAVAGASRREAATLWPSYAVAAFVLLLHLFNAIPPVPLVKKEMLVAHDVRRSAAIYEASIEPVGRKIWRSSSTTFHRDGDDPVFCFTSVFVPAGIETTIRHRWEVWSEAKGEWQSRGEIPFRIQGGRSGGYRGYTYKNNIEPGEWRVLALAESGATIGHIGFEIVEGKAPQLKKVRL